MGSTGGASPESQAAAGVRRYAGFIELDPEHERLYRELHADVWPEVVAAARPGAKKGPTPSR